MIEAAGVDLGAGRAEDELGGGGPRGVGDTTANREEWLYTSPSPPATNAQQHCQTGYTATTITAATPPTRPTTH
jgi:hypothetical protein